MPDTLESLLNLPDEIQSTPYSCGAACVVSVARYFGIEPDSEEEAIQQLGSTPADGTHPESIIDVLQDHGLDVESHEGMSLDDLRDSIDRGCPVIVPIQAYTDDCSIEDNDDGHYVVVIGFEDEQVQLMDPVKGHVEMDCGLLDACWHDEDAEGNVLDHYGISVGKDGEGDDEADKIDLQEDGFTGTSSPGHCYANGVRIPCGPKVERKAKRQQRRERHEQRSKGATGRAVAASLHVATSAKDAAQRFGAEVYEKLPEAAQSKLRHGLGVAKAIEHHVMAGFRKSREMVVRVAKERGMSGRQARKVARIVGVVDVAAAWTVNMPATMSVTGNPLAAKVSSWVPLASIAYIAYSALRNPMAVLRAAQAMLARDPDAVKTIIGEAEEDEGSGEEREEQVAKLLDRLEANDGSEWYLALVHVALDEADHDLGQAIDMAGAAYEEDPEGPGDEEVSEEDADYLKALLSHKDKERDEDEHAALEARAPAKPKAAPKEGMHKDKRGYRMCFTKGKRVPCPKVKKERVKKEKPAPKPRVKKTAVKPEHIKALLDHPDLSDTDKLARIRDLVVGGSLSVQAQTHTPTPAAHGHDEGPKDEHWGNKDVQPFYRPGPNPTVDNVITRDNPETGEREVLLIQRGPGTAEGGKWALPGGFHDTKAKKGEPWKAGHETSEQAAMRELTEETGLDATELQSEMRHVGKYGEDDKPTGRDPRDNDEAWSVSNAYHLHLTPELAGRAVAGTDDASDAKWIPAKKLSKMKLAFDHGKILGDSGALDAGPKKPTKPTRAKREPAPKATAPSASVQAHAEKLKALYDRTFDPGGASSSDVAGALTRLQKSDVPDLAHVAIQLGVMAPKKSKNGLLDQIRAKFTEADRARQSMQV